jgi:hypothetical protein
MLFEAAKRGLDPVSGKKRGFFQRFKISHINETRCQSGFQKLVDLTGQFSKQFVADLGRLANLAN